MLRPIGEKCCAQVGGFPVDKIMKPSRAVRLRGSGVSREWDFVAARSRLIPLLHINKKPPLGGFSLCCKSGLGFWSYDYFDFDFNVGVQMHDYVEFADASNGAFAHDDFGFFQLMAGFGESFGNITGTD